MRKYLLLLISFFSFFSDGWWITCVYDKLYSITCLWWNRFSPANYLATSILAMVLWPSQISPLTIFSHGIWNERYTVSSMAIIFVVYQSCHIHCRRKELRGGFFFFLKVMGRAVKWAMPPWIIPLYRPSSAKGRKDKIERIYKKKKDKIEKSLKRYFHFY